MDTQYLDSSRRRLLNPDKYCYLKHFGNDSADKMAINQIKKKTQRHVVMYQPQGVEHGNWQPQNWTCLKIFRQRDQSML